MLDDGIELNSAIQTFADPPTTEQAYHHPYPGNNVLLCWGFTVDDLRQPSRPPRRGQAAELAAPQAAAMLFSTIAAFDEIATTFS